MTSRLAALGSSLADYRNYLSQDDSDETARRLLARELSSGRVVAYVGSGISRCYGLPSWEDLVATVVTLTDPAMERQPNERLTSKFLSALRLSKPEAFLIELQMARSRVVRLPEKEQKLVKSQIDAYMNATFAERTLPPLDPDPIELLYRLGIRRFITTNFDNVLEERLEHIAKTKPTCIDVEHPQIDKVAAQVVQFALGTPGYRFAVLHRHGRVTTKRADASLVLSEDDYQRLYVARSARAEGYRAAEELLFAANPLLFIGTSLDEVDVFAPLRRLLAEKERHTRELPWFAAFSEPDPEGLPNTAADVRRFFSWSRYLRYGVKSVFHPTSKVDWHQGYCDLLRGMQTEVDRWWKEWQAKPRLRSWQPHGPADQVILHEDMSGTDACSPRSNGAIFANSASKEAVASFLAEVRLADPPAAGSGRPNPYVRVFVGGTGTGKGSLGVQIARCEVRGSSDFQPRFHATMRFRNEYLCVIEAISTTLLGGEYENELPMTRLRRALRVDPFGDVVPRPNRPPLVVIGGIELLLRRAATATRLRLGEEGLLNSVVDEPPPTATGDPASAEIREFFSVLLASRVPVILLGTQWSHHFRAKVIALERPEISDVLEAFRGHGVADEQLIRELYAVLNGNAYALHVLLNAFPEGYTADDALTWLQRTLAEVTKADRSRRPGLAIRLAIDQAAAVSTSAMLLRVLTQVALVTTPTSLAAIAVALAMPEYEVAECCSCLVQRGLLLPIDAAEPIEGKASSPWLGTSQRRYTAHSLMRRVRFDELDIRPVPVREPQEFILAPYAEEAGIVYRTSQSAHETVGSAVKNLLAAAEERRGSLDDVRGFLRSAFGMVRSVWNAAALSELYYLHAGAQTVSYTEYHRRLLQIANLAVDVDAKLAWRLYTGPGGTIHTGRIFYADELAWLYSEIAQVSHLQGHLREAASLWTQAGEVGVAADRGVRGRRWYSSQLGLAITNIERGRLTRALDVLTEGARAAERDDDRATALRIQGFIGWIHHLRGDFSIALRNYTTALRQLQPMLLHRTRSVLLRLRGGLFHRLQDMVSAERDFRESERLAEAGGYHDLANMTRVSLALFGCRQDRPPKSKDIEEALEFARRMGIPKLETEAYRALSEAALLAGDYSRADVLVHRALAIATSLGMELRETALLVLAAKVAARRGRTVEARALLEAAISLGRELGYQLQVDDAEELHRGLATV
ncbi:MAG TPA: SIR2 family protein [Candidatus Binatia bacterium]|nr:SIR2 family protein [Candidatus Binatia bacterium]